VAIRLTNSPPETLIGRRVVTVASAVYGHRDYLARPGGTPRWIGVECCDFHRDWTRAACRKQPHRFVSDDTLLTLAAIREGLGISYLPCFMGDSDPALERYRPPDPAHDLGLWILLHPDLKRTARVLTFRDYMTRAIAGKRHLFEGRPSRAEG
jgi:DNA-binding transcriptional LysR family regulator